MLDLIFVALMQAVSGDPAQPADAAPQAQAATEQPSEQPTVETPAAAPTEVVRCRRERIVGTRLSERICTTASQDAAMADDARNMVNRAQSQMPQQSN